MRLEEVTTTLQVRPADLDSLGHVNNATVLEYLEAGRWAWMEHHGVQQGRRILPVVSRIEITYVKEIPYQELVVRSALEELPADFNELITYRVVFRQDVLVAEGALAAKARVDVAFIDAETRSLRTLQDFLAPTSASLT
jgi:YbgC/YbaW family acyl-CoA thioester hydrolase